MYKKAAYGWSFFLNAALFKNSKYSTNKKPAFMLAFYFDVVKTVDD